MQPNLKAAMALLDLHFECFHAVEPYALRTQHPAPSDTRGWSQVLVSTITGVNGLARKKGPDLCDGSDVKAANTWTAIDTPRFNGAIKAGTKAASAGSMASLDAMPYLYFVLWDETVRQTSRCRIWAVRTQHDQTFRSMCKQWYAKCATGEISSSNFQLHPPRGKDSNELRNTCGNLEYPLLFSAERAAGGKYQLTSYEPTVLDTGACTLLP